MQEFILSRARLCFRTEIWSDIQSKEAIRSFWAAFVGDHQQVAHSIGGDVGQELGSPSPSCGVRLSPRCVPVSARSREQGRLPCTCSWLGVSPAKYWPLLWPTNFMVQWLGQDFMLSFNSRQKICEARHTCIFFDIHGEHSCLLPSARDIGTRKRLLSQSSQLSSQSAFEEIWLIGVILCAVHLWHLSKEKLSSVVLTLKSTALYHGKGSELGEFLKPGLWKDSNNSLLWWDLCSLHCLQTGFKSKNTDPC